ncbi:hypothetical protein ACRRTK_004881 [Alexandromys fortis]
MTSVTTVLTPVIHPEPHMLFRPTDLDNLAIFIGTNHRNGFTLSEAAEAQDGNRTQKTLYAALLFKRWPQNISSATQRYTIIWVPSSHPPHQNLCFHVIPYSALLVVTGCVPIKNPVP